MKNKQKGGLFLFDTPKNLITSMFLSPSSCTGWEGEEAFANAAAFTEQQCQSVVTSQQCYTTDAAVQRGGRTLRRGLPERCSFWEWKTTVPHARGGGKEQSCISSDPFGWDPRVSSQTISLREEVTSGNVSADLFWRVLTVPQNLSVGCARQLSVGLDQSVSFSTPLAST